MRICIMELVRRPGYMKLSLHDDIESLDAETSGRRQRVGWRPRNTVAAFGTWPIYSGASSGSSANQRGTSMSEQLSHRDGLHHLDRGNLGQRAHPGWWVPTAGTSRGRGTPPNQRGTNVNQRRTNTNQRVTNTNQRGSYTNQRGNNANQRGTNANLRWTNANQRGTNASGIHVNQRGISINQRGTQTHQRGMPANRGRTSAYQRGMPVNQRGTQVNQRGLPALRRGVPANRGRASSNQRGTQVNRGRSSQRGTPVNQRGTSPPRLYPHRYNLKPFRPRRPEVPEKPWWFPWSMRSGSPGSQSSSLPSSKDQRLHETSADQHGTLADQHGTSTDQYGTLVNQKETSARKRGTSLDEHGIPQSEQPPLSDTTTPGVKPATWRSRMLGWWPRRGSTTPKVKWTEEKQPRSLLLKQWVSRLLWWWPRRGSAAGIKPKVKAVEDDRRTTMPNQETEMGQNDMQTPQMLENEELMKAETDAEGLDPESLMFRDGLRRIDMVIAFREDSAGVMAWHRKRRNIYQENLIKEGLELELEHKSLSFNGTTWFLKVHIPWNTQLRIAEVIGLKLPTKQFISISVNPLPDHKVTIYEKKWYVRWRQWFNRIFDLDLSKAEPSFNAVSKNSRREEQFLVKDREPEFTPAQRSLLAMQILLRAKYSDVTNQFGIRRLLAAKTYHACFPLHEGQYDKTRPDGSYTDRQLLYKEWARPSNWYKRQPLWLVHKYFGDQIGLYYAWLGFYTKMLIAPAAVGCVCFLYGIASETSKDNIPSKEICDTNGPGNITLCPLCDKACSYQKLSESCVFAQLTYLIDNPMTVFFSIFMSFWATTFLVLWKREQSVIQWQWDLSGKDLDENPRPEYEASVRTTRVNPVTGERELYLSSGQKLIRRVATTSAVLMMLAVSLASALGVIIYRIAMVAVIYRGSSGFLKEYARVFTILTAAIINLTVSEILIKIFTKVALDLTNLENPRTQTEYEDSYTFKMFVFECVNFYATLVYIAFFKGTFYDHPGDKEARKSPVLKIKGDICFHSGCLSELCVQLAVSMIGKQSFQNIKEMGIPFIKNWWRHRSHRSQTLDLSKPHMAWEMDYHLQDPGHLALYDEYLEMIMQYGFVTLFVAAFPLGPLIALLNNICEIRLDAYKMVTQARRPLAERVEDIGAWYGVLRLITYVAVASNAFVLAYTSDFIPRMVYLFVYSPKGSLEGYVNHSLSWFNTSDFLADWGADDSEWDPPQCAYWGYRNPPEHPNPYGRSPFYWHVFAARLAFVVVFEHLVFSLTELMHSIIPKVPVELLRQMKREAMVEKEAKYGRMQYMESMAYPTSKTDGNGHGGLKGDDAGVRFSWKDEGSQKVAI